MVFVPHVQLIIQFRELLKDIADRYQLLVAEQAWLVPGYDRSAVVYGDHVV
jgi:hypothetical protein